MSESTVLLVMAHISGEELFLVSSFSCIVIGRWDLDLECDTIDLKHLVGNASLTGQCLLKQSPTLLKGVTLGYDFHVFAELTKYFVIVKTTFRP